MNTERTWCGNTVPHVGHPVDQGRWRCRGSGQYADDARPVPLSDKPCGYVGTITGTVVWECVAVEHETDPTRGYNGSGHNMVARPRVAGDG